MSKIPSDVLREKVEKLLHFSKEEKPRNFKESIELQVVLKQYDTQKDKRFNGSIRLPHLARPRQSVCVLGDQYHCEKAAAAGIPFHDTEYLKSLNKNKKLVKQLAQRYDAFLASESILKQIPRLLGPGLSKAGKFPSMITRQEDLEEKVAEIRSTVKFQLKKSVTLAVAVSHVDMSVEHIMDNIKMSVNLLVSLLKKTWQNVGTLHIKSTMGPPLSIY